MIKVGVTGGIGSGKTTICNVFSKLGIPVYDADRQAKNLMNGNLYIKQNLISKFGDDIYDKGILNRARLASIIFSDKEALAFVNRLVHPAVAKDSEQWFLHHKNEPYRIKEAALFFESGQSENVDIMITVVAPENLRFSRVMERDGISSDQVRKRMENQLPDKEKMKKSDFVIINDEKNSVLEQILNIHQLIISKNING